METAILGGGCFWCTEAAFSELQGVTAVQSGYAGGDVENPTYKAVCTGPDRPCRSGAGDIRSGGDFL